MMIALLCAVLVAVASAQHNTDHMANYHALLNLMEHYYEHVIDADKDGCATLMEELAQFNSEDTNGDCQMSWDEFHAARLHVHGPVHPTTEQLRMQFDFADTRGNTQPADNMYTCDDVRYFNQRLDMNGDGCVTIEEWDQVLKEMAMGNATPMPTTMPPTMP